jgi:hypothetical protein
MGFFTNFDDHFLFIVALVCGVLVFVDWAIGTVGRASMRQQLAEWWIRLDDNTFAGLVAQHAGRLKDFFLKHFGKKWYSSRRVLMAILVSSMCFLVVATLINIDSVAGFHSNKALEIFILLIPNAIFDWLMLNQTIFLLRFIERSTSLFRLLVIAAIGFLAAMLKPFIVLPMGMILESAWELSGATPVIHSAFDIVFGQPPPVPPPACVECLFDEWFVDLFKIVFAVILTGFIWSITHIFAALTFAASKLFRPIVKPLLSWLLYRFQESEKGVLTVIATGGGTVAKLIQQAAKLYL